MTNAARPVIGVDSSEGVFFATWANFFIMAQFASAVDVLTSSGSFDELIKHIESNIFSIRDQIDVAFNLLNPTTHSIGHTLLLYVLSSFGIYWPIFAHFVRFFLIAENTRSTLSLSKTFLSFFLNANPCSTLAIPLNRIESSNQV